MDMYNLNQIPSEAKINKYLKQAIFGNKYPFCPVCRKTNPLRYEIAIGVANVELSSVSLVIRGLPT